MSEKKSKLSTVVGLVALFVAIVIGGILWGAIGDAMEKDARARFKSIFGIELPVVTNNQLSEEQLEQIRPYVLKVIDERRTEYERAAHAYEYFLERKPATNAEEAQKRLADLERVKTKATIAHFAFYQATKAAEAIPGLMDDSGEEQ